MGVFDTWCTLVVSLLYRIGIDLLSLFVSPFLAAQYTRKKGWDNKAVKKMKSVLITGASSGIGKALAVELSTKDTLMAITGRSEERLKDTARLCVNKGARVVYRALDVTDKKAMEDFIDEVDESNGLDVVFANAGIGPRTVKDNWYFTGCDEFVEINIKGVLNTVLPAIAKMRGRKRGHVCVLGSMDAFAPAIASGMYSATKAALYHMCEDFRPLLRFYNIGISLACPGFTDTRLFPKTHTTRDFNSEILKPQVTAKQIVAGVRANEPVIAFPKDQFRGAWLRGTLHPIVWSYFASSGYNGKPPLRAQSMSAFTARDYFDAKDGECWH